METNKKQTKSAKRQLNNYSLFSPSLLLISSSLPLEFPWTQYIHNICSGNYTDPSKGNHSSCIFARSRYALITSTYSTLETISSSVTIGVKPSSEGFQRYLSLSGHMKHSQSFRFFIVQATGNQS